MCWESIRRNCHKDPEVMRIISFSNGKTYFIHIQASGWLQTCAAVSNHTSRRETNSLNPQIYFFRDEKWCRCCGVSCAAGLPHAFNRMKHFMLLGGCRVSVCTRKHQNAVWIKIPGLLHPEASWKIHSMFDISSVWCSSLNSNTGHQCCMGRALSMIKGWATGQTETRLIMDSLCREKKQKTREEAFPLVLEPVFVWMHQLQEAEMRLWLS